MLIKDTIPFIDNTFALPQSTDPHLEQQDISSTMPNLHQLHIHNNYILPRSSISAGHNARSCTSSATMKYRLLLGILIRINPDGIRTQTKTKETNKTTKSMQPTTLFLTKMVGQLHQTSVWPPMTSHYYLTGQSPPH